MVHRLVTGVGWMESPLRPPHPCLSVSIGGFPAHRSGWSL